MLKIPAKSLLAVRLALAALWAYEGLWLKVIRQDPHELKIVAPAVGHLGLPGLPCMIAIGLAETALAVFVAAGIWAKPLAWVQLGGLVTMNLLGIVLGAGEIADPSYLLVHNLPTFACIYVIACCGAGRWKDG
ncbi:MAG TPA: DoxX-like family protein [Fimbriimonas sp.]|nr:DoxX-like family protein [Fimbriimonas sp.]